MANLSGKTALVTGASRGIGRASALARAHGGAQVLVHYGRGKAEAEAVVAEIRNGGGRAEALSSDLSVQRFLRTLRAAVQPVPHRAAHNRVGDAGTLHFH
jgi:3-oxoacyl-[acyl-carrier protein] reductase